MKIIFLKLIFIKRKLLEDLKYLWKKNQQFLFMLVLKLLRVWT